MLLPVTTSSCKNADLAYAIGTSLQQLFAPLAAILPRYEIIHALREAHL